MHGAISAHIYKAIFSAFYYISQPNFAILLIWVSCFQECNFFGKLKKISLWWELSVLMHSHILVGVIIIFIPYLSLIAAKHRYPCNLSS
jgi:hypothetical protein